MPHQNGCFPAFSQRCPEGGSFLARGGIISDFEYDLTPRVSLRGNGIGRTCLGEGKHVINNGISLPGVEQGRNLAELPAIRGDDEPDKAHPTYGGRLRWGEHAA